MNPIRLAPWLFLPALLFVVPAHAAKMYKWVDEQGNVYYSDKVPPDQVKHQRDELNKRGVTVRSVDRAKTEEELRAEREAADAKKAAELRAKQQAEIDRLLMTNYSSVGDIERARDSKIKGIDANIQLAEGNLKNLRTQLDAQMERAAQLERAGKPVPPEYTRDIQDTRRQIAETEDHISKRHEEQDELRARYQADIDRFKELVAARQRR